MIIRLVVTILLLAAAALILRKRTFPDILWPKAETWFGGFLFFLFSGLFIALKFNRHAALLTTGYDLSAFDYAFYNTLHGSFMYTPFFGVNYLKEHFFPLVLAVIPVYALHPGPEILLVLQAVMVAACAIPLYALSRRLTASPFFSILFVAAFLMNPFLLRGLEFDFHIEMAAPFLLCLLFLTYVREQRAAFFAVLLLFFFTKENEWITGLFLCIAFWFDKDRKGFTLPLFLFSLGYGLCILFVINPHFSAGFGKYMGRYLTFGETPFQAGF